MMTRPTSCPNCGASTTAHTGPYCHECGENLTSKPVPIGRRLHEGHVRMGAEHAAWADVVEELRAAGVGEINRGEPHEKLHDAIVRWGEELAQLRMHDARPENAERALSERREKWEAWA